MPKAKPKTNHIKTSLQHMRLQIYQRALEAAGAMDPEAVIAVIPHFAEARRHLGLTNLPKSFSGQFSHRTEEWLEKRGLSVDEDFSKQATKKFKVLRKALKELLNAVDTEKLSPLDLETNIEKLTEAVHLTPLQAKLLVFFADFNKAGYKDLLRSLRNPGGFEDDYYEALGLLLDEKPEELEAELSPSSTLVGMRFISTNSEAADRDNEALYISYKNSGFYKIHPDLLPILKQPHKTADDLIAALLGKTPETELKESNYTYLGDVYSDLCGNMEGYVTTNGRSRKNMTLAGPPGTGKTELTAVLGHKFGVPVFSVGQAQRSPTDPYHIREPERGERIEALIRAAFIMRRTGMKGILVFDEAEDALRDLNDADTPYKGSKAYTNAILEEVLKGIPVIFITNHEELFDEATQRRVMPIFYIKNMPIDEKVKAIKQKWRKNTPHKQLSVKEAQELAERSDQLTIGVIDTCIQVVAARRDFKARRDRIEGLKREIDRAVMAKNHGKRHAPLERVRDIREIFDPKLLSASKDALDLVGQFEERVQQNGGIDSGADILIAGPKGSGRESYASYFAARAGLTTTVITREPTYDDFELAGRERRAVIIRDATDFVREQNPSAKSQLLRLARAHPGPTFFLADYDPGEKLPHELLNIFTFAVRTGYLNPEQQRHACEALLGLEEPMKVKMDDLPKLTIGDFAVVQRQLVALGQTGNQDAIISRLRLRETSALDVYNGPSTGTYL